MIRLISISGLCLLAALPARAAERPYRYQITPFVGYRIGGDFEDKNSDAELEVDESSSYGLILNFPADAKTEWEIYVSRQPTELKTGGLFVGRPVLDLDVDYYQLGGTYLGDGKNLLPFFVATVGASRFNPDESGFDTETFFAFTFGGGIKTSPENRLGLRLEGRVFGSLIDGGSDVFCQGSGGATCLIEVRGTVLWQWEVNAGLIFRF